MIPVSAALDALNFLSADVRNLFGPFVNVFLVTGRHWSQTDVGLVTTASGLLGIALQTPIGAAIDVTRAKRGVICLTMAAMTAAGVIIFAAPTFWPIAIALSILAVAGDAFAPAVSLFNQAAYSSGVKLCQTPFTFWCFDLRIGCVMEWHSMSMPSF